MFHIIAMYSYDYQIQRSLVEMIEDQNKSAVENETHEDVPAIPAVPRIPPMIALSAKIFNERITVRFTKNNYEIKKPEYTSVTTIKTDNRLASGTEDTNSDTENKPSENFPESEEMPPRSKSPNNFTMYESSSPDESVSSSSKEVFECEFCPKRYTKKKRFLKHKKRHLARRSFPCKQCGQIFVGRSAWDYHMKSKHLNQREFACEECGKDFVTKYALTAHIKSHKYPCHFCGKLFTAMYKLKKHKEIHRIFQCDHCPKGFFRPHRLERHLKLRHPGAQLQTAVVESSQPEEPNCQEESDHSKESICQEEFNQAEKLIPKEEPMCQDEEQNFSEDDESSHDEESSPVPTPQRCRHCGRIFPSWEDLQHHWRVTGDNLIICVHCFEICDDELTFSKHLLKHSEEKIFMCTTCSKTFVTMDLLESHFSTHSSQSD